MTRFAIDAPTLLHLVTTDVKLDPRHQLVAPKLIHSHALNLLLDEVRAGRLMDAAALQLHERITELKIRLLGDRVSRRGAWKLAREHDWPSTYSAEYLAVAKLQADAFITIDPEMAARAAGIVVVSSLEDLTQP